MEEDMIDECPVLKENLETMRNMAKMLRDYVDAIDDLLGICEKSGAIEPKLIDKIRNELDCGDKTVITLQSLLDKLDKSDLTCHFAGEF
jgi:hypothetical protein